MKKRNIIIGLVLILTAPVILSVGCFIVGHWFETPYGQYNCCFFSLMYFIFATVFGFGLIGEEFKTEDKARAEAEDKARAEEIEVLVEECFKK